MKWFISQKMAGRTDEEVQAERKLVTDAIKKLYPNDTVLDSFTADAEHTLHNRLWYLGYSLQFLSEADICVFVDDAPNRTSGCFIEYEACNEYKIRMAWFDTDTGHLLM